MPRLGLLLLVGELFGQTSDESRYVYVSDGGHFENLGLYELVHRRCKFIIVSDVSDDPDSRFGALANAVERIRTDFGVMIDIDLAPLRKDPATGLTSQHCAVGTIRYDDSGDRGFLVYLKTTRSGHESPAVRGYAADHPGFPHQSTADQFFDEAQFEAYRELGLHIAREVFDIPHGMQRTDKIFRWLRHKWGGRAAQASI